MENAKGKHNKLKIGDKVEATRQLIEWFASHLSWCYSLPTKVEDGFLEGEREIPLKDAPKIYAWCLYALNGKKMIGTVLHYGASDCTEKNGKKLDRNSVYVNFTFNTELGKYEYATYVNEENVVLKKKKKKKTQYRIMAKPSKPSFSKSSIEKMMKGS